MSYDGSIKFDTKIDTEGLKAGIGKLNRIAKAGLIGVVGALGTAAGALGAAATAGVKYNSQMEQYITSFGTMLGSAEKATGLVNKLKEMGAKTPFETSDLAKGAQTLLAFGTAEEKLLPTMQMIGDVSQGNKERFDGLTLAFGQMSSAGKLSGQDLLQMVNAGFNPLNEISKKTGESMTALRDRMSKGAISADEVAEAFKNATSEGGMFYGAMEAQSKTFNGQLSTMKDNAMSLLGAVTSGLQDILKNSALPTISGWIGELQKAFDTAGLQGLISSVGDVLAQVITKITEYMPQFINLAISLIQSFVVGIVNNLPQISAAASNIMTSIFNGILQLLPGIMPIIAEFGAKFVEGFIQYQTLFFAAAIQIITALVQGIATNLPTIIPMAQNAIILLANTLIENLPTIINSAMQIILALALGLAQMLPDLIPTIIDIVLMIVDTLIDNIDLLIDAAIALILGLAEGLIKALPKLIDKIPIIIEKLIQALLKALPKIAEAAGELMSKLAMGLIAAIPKALLAIAAINESIRKGLIDFFTKTIPEAGGNLVKGLVKGITDMGEWLKEQIFQFAKGVTDSIKNFFGIHSPSRVMRDEVGRYIVEGIAEGITENTSAEEAAEKKAQNIVNAFKDAVDKAEIDADTADLEYKLWEKLSNGKASEGEKASKRAELLNKQMAAQAEKVNLAEAAYNTLYDTVGASDEQTKTAYNNLLKEQTAMVDLTDQVNELKAAESDRVAKAKVAYNDYLKQNQKAMLAYGLSQADVEVAARKASGYNNANTDNVKYTGNETQKTVNPVQTPINNMKSATDETVKYMSDELKKAGLTIPEGFFDIGKDSAENFGTGFLAKVDEVMEKIKDAINIQMQSIMPTLSYAGGVPHLVNQTTTTTNLINVGTTKNTAHEQANAWLAATTIERMRGGK